MSIFSQRLKLVMDERGITQAQLCAMTDIPKSAMTQYLSAKFEPRRPRTDIICRALDINSAWLIGISENRTAYGSSLVELTDDEERIIAAYREHPGLRPKFHKLARSYEKAEIFRAAKSKNGEIPPARETMSKERYDRLTQAPITDEDL